jgi:3-oxoacyl-(acyl-carrier-protein) synthase/acyl carrier protein
LTYLKDIEKSLKEVIAELLDSSDDTLNLDASFLELGINSVLAVELVEAMNQKLGIDLGVEVVFDYRDVKELTHFIFQRYGKEDFSKKHLPLEDDIRFSGEGSIDSGHKALVPAIEERDNKQEALGERRSPDVAIIGISGRFAGSANLEAFWSHLQTGESCIEEIQRKGWETPLYYDPDPERPNTSISKWGGMLQDIDRFDPFFFNISPREATRMDPQQRIFLQEAYRAFEDAGYSSEELSDKKVGVFVGARPGDYKELRRDSALRLSGEIDSHLFLGSDMAILAARISYFLNCKGPSLTIDTACSSSLVAIHLACESIRTGESEMALAGGVFVLTSPEFYVMTSKTQMLSPDGKCKTFDNTANGIVIGEGVGAVILKPLEAALEDGDHIYGIIKGSGVNQDGRTKGITAPSMLSQKALLSDVYRKASIRPETVSYIETHGTGTKLGDPIEIKALTEAFCLFTDKTQFCAIGSHKPNFGHTIMSAGIAGVFKILLAMKYQQIPPTINIEEVNQHIDLQESPFFINTELREWKRRDGSPRRAGVSSFGFSGTNCHLILEEPPLNEETAPKPTRPAYFFPLSAKTTAALKQKVADLVKWLEKEGETYSLADISYTLVHGRSHFSVRSAVVARDANDLLYALRAIMSKGEGEHNIENEKGHRLEQMEPLFQAFGNRLLDDFSEDTIFEHEEYKEKWLILADLYVKGYDLDWCKIFKKGRYHRVPLPTYPFIGESYWIAESNKQKRVALRPLAEHSDRVGTVSAQGTGQGADLSVPTAPARPDPANTVGIMPCADPGSQWTGTSPVPMHLSPTVSQLEEALARSLAAALYMEKSAVDLEKPFGEMGLDSVLGVEWIRSLNKQYASSLKAICVYDYPTIRQLAAFLQKEMLQQGGGIQQTSVQSMSTDVPQQGTCKLEEAEHLFHQPEEIEGRTPGTRTGAVGTRRDSGLPLSAWPSRPTYQRVIVEGPEGIDDLLISEADMPELKDDEVRIAVRAFSLNFGDLLCVKGLYPTMPPYPFTPGFEASGVVLAVGRAVTAFQIGDPVMAMAGATLGAQASVMTCLEEHVFHKPAALSFEEACALPVVAITMIAAFEKAHLKRGEKILIHTATSGTGLIAIRCY